MLMMGAETSSVQVISTSICTCWTSFVERVMSDAAPKRVTSCSENMPTWLTTASRRSRPTLMAVREPKYTATIAHRICANEMRSITAPIRRI